MTISKLLVHIVLFLTLWGLYISLQHAASNGILALLEQHYLVVRLVLVVLVASGRGHRLYKQQSQHNNSSRPETETIKCFANSRRCFNRVEHQREQRTRHSTSQHQPSLARRTRSSDSVERSKSIWSPELYGGVYQLAHEEATTLDDVGEHDTAIST
jgi:hypothetical protein